MIFRFCTGENEYGRLQFAFFFLWLAKAKAIPCGWLLQIGEFDLPHIIERNGSLPVGIGCAFVATGKHCKDPLIGRCVVI